MKRLGGSFDWNRVAYTMNDVRVFIHSTVTRSVPKLFIAAIIESRDGKLLQPARARNLVPS